MAVAGLIVLAGLVLVLVLRNPSPPAPPGDADHVWHGPDTCLVCHDASGAVPRSPNHPVGRECLRCHGLAP